MFHRRPVTCPRSLLRSSRNRIVSLLRPQNGGKNTQVEVGLSLHPQPRPWADFHISKLPISSSAKSRQERLSCKVVREDELRYPLYEEVPNHHWSLDVRNKGGMGGRRRLHRGRCATISSGKSRRRQPLPPTLRSGAFPAFTP